MLRKNNHDYTDLEFYKKLTQFIQESYPALAAAADIETIYKSHLNENTRLIERYCQLLDQNFYPVIAWEIAKHDPYEKVNFSNYHILRNLVIKLNQVFFHIAVSSKSDTIMIVKLIIKCHSLFEQFADKDNVLLSDRLEQAITPIILRELACPSLASMLTCDNS